MRVGRIELSGATPDGFPRRRIEEISALPAPALTEEERTACRAARVGASNEVDDLIDIIERLSGEELPPPEKLCSCGCPLRWNGGTWQCLAFNCSVGEIGRYEEPPPQLADDSDPFGASEP